MTNPLVAFAALALMAVPLPAIAGENEEHERIVSTVEAFMQAFEARDADAMRALVTQPGQLALIEEREGEDRIGVYPMDQSIEGLVAVPGMVEEPIWNLRVMHDGPLATVWADYEFLLNGERQHCGVDLFTLMRVDDDWRIVAITYSHVEEGCSEAPYEGVPSL